MTEGVITAFAHSGMTFMINDLENEALFPKVPIT